MCRKKVKFKFQIMSMDVYYIFAFCQKVQHKMSNNFTVIGFNITNINTPK